VHGGSPTTHGTSTQTPGNHSQPNIMSTLACVQDFRAWLQGCTCAPHQNAPKWGGLMHLGKSACGQSHNPWHQHPNSWKPLPVTHYVYPSLCTRFQVLDSRLYMCPTPKCTKLGGLMHLCKSARGQSHNPWHQNPNSCKPLPATHYAYYILCTRF
jgi:hypothetical protein